MDFAELHLNRRNHLRKGWANSEVIKQSMVHASKKEDISLSNFCASAMEAYRKHSKRARHKGGMALSDQRIEQMNALGFEWAANRQGGYKDIWGQSERTECIQ